MVFVPVEIAVHIIVVQILSVIEEVLVCNACQAVPECPAVLHGNIEPDICVVKEGL